MLRPLTPRRALRVAIRRRKTRDRFLLGESGSAVSHLRQIWLDGFLQLGDALRKLVTLLNLAIDTV